MAQSDVYEKMYEFEHNYNRLILNTWFTEVSQSPNQYV